MTEAKSVSTGFVQARSIVEVGEPTVAVKLAGAEVGVVSITIALLAARLVAGVKLTMVLLPTSVTVHETDATVRSDDVSPDWTV